MARPIYSGIMSINNYLDAKTGSFDWAAPDDEERSFFNTLEGRLAIRFGRV